MEVYKDGCVTERRRVVGKYQHEEKFGFPVNMDMTEVTEWLALAVLDAKAMLGQEIISKDLQYCVCPDDCTVFVDVSTDGGKHVARVFKALIERAKSTKKWRKMMDARKTSDSP
jgi:hypothetical protein